MVTTLPVHKISLLCFILRLQHYLELAYFPEAVVPYAAFKSAGFSISFATEIGKPQNAIKRCWPAERKNCLSVHPAIPLTLAQTAETETLQGANQRTPTLHNSMSPSAEFHHALV